MGELHLEIIVDRLLREFQRRGQRRQAAGRLPRDHPPARREAQGKFVRQTGGRGQYGDVYIEVEPNEPGEGFVFENKIVGGSVPREYVPAVEKGIKEAMETGVLAGYPMVDIKVLPDGRLLPRGGLLEMAFKIAGSMGFKEACRKAKPVLLEPVMDVEVVTPEEYMGAIVGDLNSRRGRIISMEARGTSAGHPRQRAARPDVRLRDRDAVDDPGARHLHDAVRPLRGGARPRSPKRSWPRSPASPPPAPAPAENRRVGGRRRWRRRSTSGRSRT